MAKISDELIRKVLLDDGLDEVDREEWLIEIDRDPDCRARFDDLALEIVLSHALDDGDSEFESLVRSPSNDELEHELTDAMNKSGQARLWSFTAEDSARLGDMTRNGGEINVTAIKCNRDGDDDRHWQQIDSIPLTVRCDTDSCHIDGLPCGVDVLSLRIWNSESEMQQPIDLNIDPFPRPGAGDTSTKRSEDPKLLAASALTIQSTPNSERPFCVGSAANGTDSDFDCEIGDRSIHLSARMRANRTRDRIVAELEYENRFGDLCMLRSLVRVESQRVQPDWSRLRTLPIPHLNRSTSAAVRLRLRSFGGCDVHLLPKAELESYFADKSMVAIVVRDASLKFKNRSQRMAAMSRNAWAVEVVE